MLMYRCEQERRLTKAHSYRLLNILSEMLQPFKSKGKSRTPHEKEFAFFDIVSAAGCCCYVFVLF